MRQKKGSIELSITTIIIIVIGITLLILGLGFVRSIFGSVSKISEDTISKARNMIDTLEVVKNPLTLSPSEIEVEQSKDEVVKIILANNFDANDLRLNVKIVPSQNDNKIDCYIYDENAKVTKTGSYTISSGKQINIALIAKDLDGPIRTTACQISVTGLPAGQDNEETLLVRVKEKQSLFG